MRRIAVLGSTGSIGRATLAVAADHPDLYDVVALAAGVNISCLREQIRHHNPKAVSVARANDARELAREFPGLQVLAGIEGLETLAMQVDAEMVVVAVVGSVGVVPTLAAIRSGKNIALANKESLVAAGDLIMEAVRDAGVDLMPLDSEHSALHQTVDGKNLRDVSRLILTASGGPFRTWTAEAIAEATVDDALEHPTWRMGPKITIDSATLMNKGFEIIEAHHLFGVSQELIDVVVHPQSLIHAMVEWRDGSFTMQMATNDMRLAIGHALAWPERLDAIVPRLDLTTIPALTFEAPDVTRFPALALARDALRAGGEMPVVLNAANETAVVAFLDGRCAFRAVTDTVAATLETWAARNRPLTGIEQVLAVDGEARSLAAESIMKYGAPVLGSEKRC